MKDDFAAKSETSVRRAALRRLGGNAAAARPPRRGPGTKRCARRRGAHCARDETANHECESAGARCWNVTPTPLGPIAASVDPGDREADHVWPPKVRASAGSSGCGLSKAPQLPGCRAVGRSRMTVDRREE